ncbi:MAG: LVIVD repeat-containing protein [Candidatus Hodarchaeota archaeon]
MIIFCLFIKNSISELNSEPFGLEYRQQKDIQDQNNKKRLNIKTGGEKNPPAFKNSIFQSKALFIEDFDSINYLNETATNTSGWGDGSIHLGIGGLKSVNMKDTGRAYDIHVCGNYAFVAAWGKGLGIIDISDPTNLSKVIYRRTTGSAQGIYIQDDFAYLATGDTGLAIINISDPFNPGIPVYRDTIGDAQAVYVCGNYTYLALWNEGVAIINTTDPTNPGPPTYRDTTGYACDIHVHNNFIYVADHWNGVAIISISDPTNPGYPGYHGVNGEVWSVFVRDNYAYVAVFENGLAIFDISNPFNPGSPIYKNIQEHSYPLDVFVAGDFAYLAASNIGSLVAINISDPGNPGNPIYKFIFNECSDVFVSRDYVYVTHRLFGFMIVEAVCQASLSVAQSNSCYMGEGFVQNVTLNANQTVYVNTSIKYQISSDGYTWIPLILNETHSFVTNPYHSLYWRAILETENISGLSPRIDSIKIEFDVYLDEDSPYITLINVLNNSIISKGTIIECSISDFTLIQSWFNWDNGFNLSLTEPWTIVCPPFSEGYHWLNLYAKDVIGHQTRNSYQFYISSLSHITLSTHSIPRDTPLSLLPYIQILGISTILFFAITVVIIIRRRQLG